MGSRSALSLVAVFAVVLLLSPLRSDAGPYPMPGGYYTPNGSVAVLVYRTAHDVIHENGAKCDGVTDDSGAIIASINKAIADKYPVYIPPQNDRGAAAVCMVNQEIQLNVAGLSLLGEQVDGVGSTIRASTAMHAVIGLHTNSTYAGNVENGRTRIKLQGVVIDANFLASNAVFQYGAEFPRMEDVWLENAPQSCWRESYLTAPATLGSVSPSVPGGSPSGVTFTLPDPYLVYSSTTASGPFAVQITGGGGLGTAQFEFAPDGMTFQTAPQTVRAVSNIALASGSSFILPYGIQAQFPGGTYHVGDSYRSTLTFTPVDFGQAIGGNGDLDALHVTTYNCGSVYTTPADAGFFSGSWPLWSLVGGTVSTTAGSPIIAGNGTSFTALLGQGQHAQFKAGGTVYQLAAVLDDVTVAVTPGVLPSANASGLDYDLAAYGGMEEDGFEDLPRNLWIGGVFNQDATCYDMRGRLGDTVYGPHLISCGLAGFSVGSAVNDSTFGAIISGPETDSAVTVPGVAFLFNQASNGHLEQPTNFHKCFGNGVNWQVDTDGFHGPCVPFGGRNFTQHSILAVQPSFVTITSAGQTIPPPDATSGTYAGNTSYVSLTTSSNITSTAAPLIAYPGQQGVRMTLVNTGSNTFTIGSHATTGSGIVIKNSTSVTLAAGGGALELVSLGFGGAPFWVAVGTNL